MTMQVPDFVVFEDQEFQLVGVKGSPLIKPQDYGIEPASWATSCWRGYVATYSVVNEQLFLRDWDMDTVLGDIDEANKVLSGLWEGCKETGIALDFTGVLRLAERNYPVWFCLDIGVEDQPPIGMLDLLFENGHLKEVVGKPSCPEGSEQSGATEKQEISHPQSVRGF